MDKLTRKHVQDYAGRAEKELVWSIAAQAWHWGLPWAEALPIAQKALEKGSPKPKCLPKAKGRPKAKP